MPLPAIDSIRRIFHAWRWELVLALLVVGTRLWVFAYAGSPLPYYDQWVAEYNNLFLAISRGTPVWRAVFAPHNEHILATTRLVSLTGFLLNGYWDVKFLVAVSAFVRAFEAALLFRLLSRGASRSARIATWSVIAVVFVAPVSGFNLLCGLQVSFYFAELALIGALLCLEGWRSPGRSGAALVLINVIGLISMGSAVAIPVATLVAHVASRRQRRGFWPAWLLSVVAVVAYALPRAGRHGGGVPLLTRATFFLRLLAWPFGAPWVAVGVILMVAIAIGLLARNGMLRRQPFPVVLGVGTFAAVNSLFIATNRLPSEFHLRHWEAVALVPLAVWVFAANVVTTIPRPAAMLRWFMLAGAAAYLAMFTTQIVRHSWPYIAGARQHRAEALTYYRRLFMSPFVGEASRINDDLMAKDYSFFDDPILRFTPHPFVLLNMAKSPLQSLALLGPDILPTRPPSRLSRMTRRVIQAGPVFVMLGILLAAITAVGADRPWRRRYRPIFGATDPHLPTAAAARRGHGRRKVAAADSAVIE